MQVNPSEIPSPSHQLGVDPYIRVIRVRVLPNTTWQPDMAERLITSLFTFGEPLTLVIQAAPDSIEWHIELPRHHEVALIQSLYALYPQAKLTTEPKREIGIGYYPYQFHTSSPFIAPLKFAQDFGDIDPLASLISALSSLGQAEKARFELLLSSVNERHYELGRKANLAFAEKGRFTRELQKLVNEKLDGLLKQAALIVKINAASQQRANQLAAILKPALVLFGREGSNFLIQPSEASFPLVLSVPEVASLWHLASDQCQTSGISWAKRTAPLPPALMNQRSGICLGTNKYQGRVREVWLDYPSRVTHVNLLGKTGMGKSNQIHHMIHQDIANGKAVALIDPHRALFDDVLACSIPSNREQDVVLLDVTDTNFPVGLNLLTMPPGVSPSEAAGQIQGVLHKIMSSDLSPRIKDAIHAALVALLHAPGSTIRDIPRLFYDSSYRSEILKQVTDPAALEFWHDIYETLSEGQQAQLVYPLTRHLRQFYQNESIQRMLTQVTSLDFEKILNSKSIFLATLFGLPDAEAEVLGALLISKFQVAAMSRGDKQFDTFYLYIDEVQRFITTSLPTMFSEIRKFGISAVVANQYLQQLEGGTLEAIMGNTGATIVFRVGQRDAGHLAPLLRPQFNADDLLQLDRFTAVAKIQHGTETLPAFSLNPPAPLSPPDDAPERMEQIRNLSRKKYARPKEEVDAEIQEHLRSSPEYYPESLGNMSDDSEDKYLG
jgi:hypothetical protein